ncbi:MAG: TnsA endonuclease N-terminal domain-containing protein [Fimbriimonas sp.]
MALSKHGIEWNVSKSPYNFENYDSDLERRMMLRLEMDPHVKKWTKRHGISIPWIDGQKHQRRYHPDFLVEYEDASRKLIEAKDKSKIDTDEVKRKRQAAELWCKRRGLEYVVVTL